MVKFVIMFNGKSLDFEWVMIGKCLQILGYNLVGGDWNHGFFFDFSYFGTKNPS